MSSSLGSLIQLRNCKSKRISSYDRTGGNDDFIRVSAGSTHDVVDIEGAGIIRHIWFTLNSKDPMFSRNAIIRMYWDDETEPSVQAPIGDFFGQGWGEHYTFMSMPLSAAPREGRSLVCYFPMPYGKRARITLENDSEHDLTRVYYYVDYEEHDSISDQTPRFHAWWNREFHASADTDDIESEWELFKEPSKQISDEGNHIIADIVGKGHFAGVNYYVHNPGPMWYGEGDDMWMIDGEPWPGSMHGTGTEDFFNTAWCPEEVYTHPYFGVARVPVQDIRTSMGFMGRTHLYRFFIEDPVCFDKSMKVSIEHGHANALALDLATVAYWYQTEPHQAFPLLPERANRQNMPITNLLNVHLWREAWRQKQGGGKLWGNEDDKNREMPSI